ncbi:MAG: LptF/LptG family permease [Acidobacteria bacterium]|nr:LptF/LptG family permease [Acidobacteriota bacterium]MCG3194291.1 hypothetical protein [Thermoanaerobaculia bacterium]
MDTPCVLSRRLDRYVAREVLGPTIVGFFAYTGFMVVRGLFQFSDLILQSPSPGQDTLLLLGLSVPHIVVLTIPISFLLGTLVGVGRLSADSEFTAMRAAGLHLTALFRPVFALSLALGGVTAWVMLGVLPGSNAKLSEKKLELSTYVIAHRIQPGVFSPEFGGRRIYVEAASADRRELRGVVVLDRSDPQVDERLIVAEKGTLELERDRGQLWLRLENAFAQQISRGGQSEDRAVYREQRTLLADSQPFERRAGEKIEKQLREEPLSGLLRRAQTSRSPVEINLSWVEIHKKFSFPAACIVFGFVGVPLGIVNRRGGRSAGFAVSVLMVLFYYMLIATGEAKAIDGHWHPALGMWLPNVLLFLFGAYAVLQVGHHRPILPLGHLADTFWRLRSLRATPEEPGGGTTPASERARTSPSDSSPVRPPAAAKVLPWGPSFLLERYLLRRFFGVFLLVLVSSASLYVIIEYLEISDDIAKLNPPASLLWRYGQSLLAPVVYDIIPYAFLVAALIAVAGMVRAAETTAVLAHGISLHRFVAPLVLAALTAGPVLFFLSDRVVPRAAEESDRIRSTILGRIPKNYWSDASTWFRGDEGRFFAAEAFDARSGRIANFTFLVLDRKTFRPIHRLDAPEARVVPGKGFVLDAAWVRDFQPNGEMLKGRQEGARLIEAPEAAEILASSRTTPATMSSVELSRFIQTRRKAGADTSALSTGLHQKPAAALSPLILTLLGIPFAFKYGKRGAVAGIGVALLVAVAYLAVSTITVRLGYGGTLDPVLAAWGPNVFFSFLVAYGVLGIRT